MSVDDIKQVKCKPCEVLLEGRPEGYGQMFYVCPSCGVGDTRDNVLREIAEQAKEHMMQKILAPFSKPGGMWTIEKQPTPKRIYRFTIDFEPTHGDRS